MKRVSLMASLESANLQKLIQEDKAVEIGANAGPDIKALKLSLKETFEKYPDQIKSIHIATHGSGCGGATIEWAIVMDGKSFGPEIDARFDEETKAIYREFMEACEKEARRRRESGDDSKATGFSVYQETQGELKSAIITEALFDLGIDLDSVEVVTEHFEVPAKDPSAPIHGVCVCAPVEPSDPSKVVAAYLRCMDFRLNAFLLKEGSKHRDHYHVATRDPDNATPDVVAAVDVIKSREVVVDVPEDKELKPRFESFSDKIRGSKFVTGKIGTDNEVKVTVEQGRSKQLSRSGS